MFTDIIDQLFFGELDPAGDCTPQDMPADPETQAYARAARAQAFRCGFALGAKLMREIDET